MGHYRVPLPRKKTPYYHYGKTSRRNCRYVPSQSLFVVSTVKMLQKILLVLCINSLIAGALARGKNKNLDPKIVNQSQEGRLKILY